MNARTGFLATLAALAAGVVLVLWAPWNDGGDLAPGPDTRTTSAGTAGEGLTAEGASGPGASEPMTAEDPGPRNPVAPPRDLDAEQVALYQRTLDEARRFIEARRLAKEADDELAEEAARAEWELARQAVLQAVKKSLPEAKALLAWLGRQEDEEAALYIGRIFPFVWVDGFEGHLLKTLESSAPILERRLALVGLRGRGLAAAKAITRVAGKAEDTTLRAHATEEIASHVADPHTAPSRGAMHETATKNLADAEASVRRAALVVLISDRRPLTEAQRDAVKARLDDPDPKIRRMASVLLKRQ